MNDSIPTKIRKDWKTSIKFRSEVAAAVVIAIGTLVASLTACPNGQKATGGSVAIGGDAIGNTIITQPRDSNITINESPPKLALRVSDPDRTVQLGATFELSVTSEPVDFIKGVTCSWKIEPSNFFLIRRGSPQRDCNLELAVPVEPFFDHPTFTISSLKATVRDGNTTVAELEDAVQILNGMLYHAIQTSEEISPGKPISVKIVQQESRQELPDGYECRWDFLNFPFEHRPTAPNSCEVLISVIDPKRQSRADAGFFRHDEVAGDPPIREGFL